MAATAASAVSFRDKGFFPSFLLPVGFGPLARGERRAHPTTAPAASERPRLVVTGAPKGYVNRGGLRRRWSSCPRTRARARSRSHRRRYRKNLSGPRSMGPLFASSRPASPLPPPRRPACPSPSRRGRGRPEILKSRNQFSIINHIFCQTAEGGREAAGRIGKEFRSVRAASRARWTWPARRPRRGAWKGRQAG